MRAAIVLVVAVACGGSEPSPTGVERAACRADGSCEVGLECWSAVCVRPPSADCGAVATRLAAVKLGNYATDEQRRPMLAELRAQCHAAKLTAREGACLTSAGTDDALADCPRALLPELDGVKRRCLPLGARVQVMVDDAGVPADLAQEASALVVEQCVAQAWPKEVTSCALAASSLDGARGCLSSLPGADRRSLERKLQRLVIRGATRRTPPPDPWAAPGSLPPACVAYIAILDQYAACAKLPPDARSAISKAAAQMKTAWSGLPASSFATSETACQQAADTIRQGMTSLGCP